MPANQVMEGLRLGDSSGITLGYAATAYVVLPYKKGSVHCYTSGSTITRRASII